MEVKYNVSAFDNTPVTASPEVHTGRAVFVDEDLYEKNASYKAKVDKCIEEGFHKVVEGESGGSGESGGDFDKGYSCTEEWVTLTDESVTTVQGEDSPSPEAMLVYSTEIDADTIRVTFNGVVYECNRTVSMLGGSNRYGATLPLTPDGTPDWSQYPFCIISGEDGNLVITQTAGAYQVKVEALNETVETSECFKKAVKAIAGTTEPLIVNVLTSSSTWQTSQNMPWQVIHDEYIKGRTILFQELAMSQKKDAFGSVVSVGYDELGQKYYIDVYVQGQLRRFSASDPNHGVTYNSAS